MSYYLKLNVSGGQFSDYISGVTEENVVQKVKDFFASYQPTIWYVPSDSAQATGLYIPVIIQGGEYRCQCLKITAPLCAGDSVVSKTRSGCDQQLALDGSTLTVAASGSDYTVVAANAVAGGKVYASGLAGLSLTAGSVTIPGTAFSSSVTNAEQANEWLQGNPQTLHYRSIAYAEAADISASLESHAQSVLVADGTTNVLTQGSGGYTLALPGAANGTVLCDTFSSLTASGGSVAIPAGKFPSSVTNLATANQWLQSNNVTFVYPLSTPIVYAHPTVDIVAVPDDTGSYTVSSQDGTTASVAFGGFASEAQGKKADTAVQTVNGQSGTSVTLSPQDVGGVASYTCSTSGKVHTLTGSGDNIKFVADAAYTEGDTVTVNGTTVTAQTQDGAALATGAWASGATVVCWLNGTTLTVGGGGNAYTPPAYSTSGEVATGETWIDGKPIYSMVYTGGALTDSTIDLGTNTQIDNILWAHFVVVNSVGNQITNPSGFINDVLAAENAWTCSVVFNASTSALSASVTGGVSPALTGWTIILYYTKN